MELAGSSGEKRGKAPAARAQMLAQKGESAVAQRLAAIEQACQAFGVVVVKKEREPKLVVVEPEETTQEVQISRVPDMPVLVSRARVENFNGGQIELRWRFAISWIARNGRHTYDEFPEAAEATTIANNSEISEWRIPWDGKIRGGDESVLTVRTLVKGKELTAIITRPYRIVGLNPTKTQIKAGMSLHEQVIPHIESSWRHFVQDRDFPLVGPTGDFGLMQLTDPTPSDQQVWNWWANREEGIARLNQKLAEGRTFPSRLRARASSGDLPAAFRNARDFETEEELWKETYQRYNYGAYWEWIPLGNPRDPDTPGEWRPRPINNYGDNAWSVYAAVRSENPPDGWND